MKVLVVEDDTKIANSIKKGLEQEAIVVDQALDGAQGLDFALSEQYDVIILDLMLPELSGEEICKELRDAENSTPILMLTAKSTLKNKVEGLNIGADDYLIKPFEFEELVARVKALARRQTKEHIQELVVGPLTLDINQRRARVNKLEVALTKKEFTLLEYLMRNKDTVLTKDQLLENVWDFEADVLPNTVEVYIRYLREKIDKQFDLNLIKTVRGFGYKISDK